MPKPEEGRFDQGDRVGVHHVFGPQARRRRRGRKARTGTQVEHRTHRCSRFRIEQDELPLHRHAANEAVLGDDARHGTTDGAEIDEVGAPQQPSIEIEAPGVAIIGDDEPVRPHEERNVGAHPQARPRPVSFVTADHLTVGGQDVDPRAGRRLAGRHVATTIGSHRRAEQDRPARQHVRVGAQPTAKRERDRVGVAGITMDAVPSHAGHDVVLACPTHRCARAAISIGPDGQPNRIGGSASTNSPPSTEPKASAAAWSIAARSPPATTVSSHPTASMSVSWAVPRLASALTMPA